MDEVDFRQIKDEIRVVGFDDGAFDPGESEKTVLVGTVLRGGQWLDGILVDEIEVDGRDSTSTIVERINASRHKEQLRVIMTSGITFGGFNVLDIEEVFERTGLPVIVVSRDRPDMESVKKALKNLPDWRSRWKLLNSAGEIYPIETENPESRKSKIYIQVKGMKSEDAEEIVQVTSTRSSIPESLRLAHIIATGISRGESVGRV